MIGNDANRLLSGLHHAPIADAILKIVADSLDLPAIRKHQLRKKLSAGRHSPHAARDGALPEATISDATRMPPNIASCMPFTT